MLRSIIVFLAFVGSAFGQTIPLEVAAPVNKLFIPNGFDSNDNVEVIIHGSFPDSCWRLGHSGATVDEDSLTIEVWATAYQYGQDTSENREIQCAQVLVPFLVPVKTGVLKPGTYTVTVRDHDASSPLTINTATTEAPDEYLYAAVNSAGVDVDPVSQTQSVWIRGSHPRFVEGCMVIDEVRAYKDPEDVLIVLPIGRMLEPDACNDGYSFSFFQRVPLVDTVIDNSLLHVRVMNGRSFNQLISIY